MLQTSRAEGTRPLPRFDAPGPGPWEAEGAHFPRPITQFAAEAFMRGFPRGFPGIVGTEIATQTIADGARVRVDGATGEVTILSAPS